MTEKADYYRSLLEDFELEYDALDTDGDLATYAQSIRSGLPQMDKTALRGDPLLVLFAFFDQVTFQKNALGVFNRIITTDDVVEWDEILTCVAFTLEANGFVEIMQKQDLLDVVIDVLTVLYLFSISNRSGNAVVHSEVSDDNPDNSDGEEDYDDDYYPGLLSNDGDEPQELNFDED